MSDYCNATGCGYCSGAVYTQATSSNPPLFTADQLSLLCGASGIMGTAQNISIAEANSISAALVGPVTEGVNDAYLLLSAALVFIMHGGFAMLCAGAIRSKNTMNILLQTILDAAMSAIGFYLFGYGFAFGGYNPANPNWTAKVPPNAFIGTSMFALSNYASEEPGNTYGYIGTDYTSVHWQDWFFQWAFAATATTIPAGAVAERFNFNAYLGYSFFISAWVYPIIVHWAWSLYGWMGYGRAPGYQFFGSGYIDFAGSGVVHMVGGFSGMWGCILVGPRMGRFDSNGNPVEMPGHSATLVVLGTILLWFGWYGFNPGSVVTIANVYSAQISGRAAVTTTLAGAGGGLAGLALAFIRNKAWDLLAVCNGVLCGFVAITAGCHVLEPWAAILDGAVASVVFEGVCVLFLKLKIDDPLNAAPMHGFAGMVGLIFVGFLAKEEYVLQAYPGTHTGFYPYGCFYPGGGGKLLASQICGILCIFGWVAVNMIPFFAIFKFFGMIRISAEEEQAGLDASKHGGSAYNYEGGVKPLSEKDKNVATL